MLAARHRWRHRRTLTALMFHRVLPAGEIERRQADPEYTVSTALFSDILVFLHRHYSVIGLADALAARARQRPLPPRALIITFDDGWRDNLDYALPILRRHGTPAVLFAARDPIAEPDRCWWQDVLLWCLRVGHRGYDELWRAAGGTETLEPGTTDPSLRLLLLYGRLDPVQRARLLEEPTRELAARQPCRQMLTPPELRELQAAGINVGAHGASHLPLTALKDAPVDVREARRCLDAWLGPDAARGWSFPHGRYDAQSVAAAREAGFALLFTSDAVINQCGDGWLGSDLVGRIDIPARAVAGPDGRLMAPQLATWLFHRPCVSLVSASPGRPIAPAEYFGPFKLEV